MSKDPKERPYLTPTEVANWMMVSPVTVRGWAQRNLLQAEVTPGGHRRFRREEVERFARQWNPAGNKGPLRVLIVDDDMGVVGFLRELIGGGDYDVVVETAHNGFDAGCLAQSFVPDVMLLDLMMPGLSGTVVCRQIKQSAGLDSVRVIAMSGYLTAENESELLAAGAERCIAKPIDGMALLKAMGLEV